MHRLIAVFLAVSLLAAACGDDEPAVADPGSLRLNLISGDGQISEVTTTPGVSADAGLHMVIGGLDMLDEPIVAQVIDEDGNVVAGSGSSVVPAGGGLLGPLATLKAPANTLVRFRIEDMDGNAAPEFGEPAIGHALPDDTGYVKDRWIKGTKAGDARMRLMLLVGDSLLAQEIARATFLPGPMVSWHLQLVDGAPYSTTVEEGDSLDLRYVVWSAADEYGNAIPLDSVHALPDSVIGWAWHDRNIHATMPRPEAPTDTGWFAVVPPPDGFILSDRYAPGLEVWINGIKGSGRDRIAFTVWL